MHATIPALGRHRLVRLRPHAWAAVLERRWDDAARSCLDSWAGHDRPLVVTRQPAGVVGRLSTGLPAPLVHGRRRLSVEIDADAIAATCGFPDGTMIVGQLPAGIRSDWSAMIGALHRLGCGASIYGGHGWQQITGMPYVHPDSDIDLLLPVIDLAMADAVCAILAVAPFDAPRIDGELIFRDGAGVSWRDWDRCRRLGESRVLVKRLHDVGLESPADVASRGEHAC